MKIDEFRIEEYKNLKDFYIDFDESQMTTVLIGHNTTGKSNLLEALVEIFRDLDLGNPPTLTYKLKYTCKGHTIHIKTNKNDKLDHTIIHVDGSRVPLTKFSKRSNREYLPNYVFAYYSGRSNRMEKHFNKHQRIFYKELIKESESLPLPLRPFFFARDIHSQFVLLSFFSFEDEISKEFLEKYLDISELESVIFVLKEPDWKGKEGDIRFWNARGKVKEFLSALYEYSISPIRKKERISLGFRKSKKEEHLYLHIPNQESLRNLAKNYGTNRDFFKMLESTYISELIHEVEIYVKKKNLDKSITFTELSEGEQQLLTVLGLLKFTKDEESLYLLDEPDTHLNPAWKLEYLDLLERVSGNNETSQIIICTHDPLVIGGLMRKQVQIFEINEETKKITTKYPELDPKGMGVAGLLTSELFGLSTTLDLDTQRKLDRKRELFIKSKEGILDNAENNEMQDLFNELGSLGFARTIRDPLYDKFVKAMMSRKEFQKPILTPTERRKLEKVANEIIDEILKEEKK